MGAGDVPIVAWIENGQDVYARSFDGTNWVERAGSATGQGVGNSSSTILHLSITIDAKGPAIAWGTNYVGIAQFDGTAWTSLPGVSRAGLTPAARGHRTSLGSPRA